MLIDWDNLRFWVDYHTFHFIVFEVKDDLHRPLYAKNLLHGQIYNYADVIGDGCEPYGYFSNGELKYSYLETRERVINVKRTDTFVKDLDDVEYSKIQYSFNRIVVHALG